jgi:ABC-type Fe3+ transport system permease subunit
MTRTGVVLLLGLRSVPLTFLAVTAALGGLGQEFEDAARAHGAGRAATLRLIVPMLAPAIWSALAIGFAESISDFGVAATLAYSSNFPLATCQLYAAINNFPPGFPAASAMGALLVAAVAIPLALAGPGAARPFLPDALGPDALPSVVFAAGYIFAYNLPVRSSIGISLYQTALLLIIAYTAASLPTSARVLSGTVSQLPPPLRDAARAPTTSAWAWPSRSSRWRWRWPSSAWPSAATGWPPRPAGGGFGTASSD